MATTPNAAPTTANVTATGTTATTSIINLTANSAATLAAAKTAITQATGKAPANTFAIGSTTSISQPVPGAKFVQGSTTTPVLNKAVSSSTPKPNTGISSIFTAQNILGAGALAIGGLALFRAVSNGINLTQSIVNNSNVVTPPSSTNNVTDPAQRAQAAAAIPSTGSTNNVSDPAQRAIAAEQAATTVVIPNTNSTNNVQDPAQRAQVADQTAIDNAQNVSTLQDPSQRQQAAITNADATSPTPVSTFSDPAQRQQALLPEPNTNSTNNVSDPASRAQANQIAIVNADNTSPTPVSTFSDPAQRAQVADQVAIDQAAATNNVSDPASRAQANQVLIENADATAPVQVSTLQDPSQRAQVADQIAIDQAQNISTLQDPAQRQQAAEQVIQEQKQADLNNEFAGVDEAVERQKQIEDGSLEFAGIDAQVADNENGLQEPPLLSDEEIDQQLQAAQDENIENDGPKDVTDDPAIKRVEDAAAEDRIAADEAAQRADSQNTQSGLTTAKQATQSSATAQDVTNAAAQGDWRVRLSLAPGSNYLYNANPPGILAPLSATGGVIFPYTPSISVTYAANYDSTDLTHTNYRYQSYKSSAVDAITIGCDFTAQDAYEANYILAVIHFFRSITKMFYGQDPGPVPGTPPPLCYLTGLGAFQFDQHPLLIQNFTYTLPTDVDYIAAGSTATQAGVNRSPSVPKSTTSGKPGESRMAAAGVQQGAVPAPPNFSGQYAGTREPTYVPTKISLSITALPVVTRNDVSNRFSLKDYATGALLRSSKTGGRGGFW